MDGYFDKSSPKTLGFLENLKFVFLSTPATQGRRSHRNKMITTPKKDKNSLSVKDALVISVSRPSNKKSTNLGLQAIAVLGEFVELLCGSPQEGYMVAFTLFRYSAIPPLPGKLPHNKHLCSQVPKHMYTPRSLYLTGFIFLIVTGS